ncbi:MAG: hypothetical protein WCA29_03585 [Jiangellales bacterium]
MTRRTLSNEVRALVTYVREQIDPDWSIHTPGWPDEIEAALIDAVMSIRATYGGPDTGVRRAVQRWREHTGGTRLDDLPRLAATDPLDLATNLGNRQRLPGNTLKAEGIVAAAEALTEAGVKRAGDLCADDDEHREAVVTVVGLGPLTWGYLAVLVAVADRPADQRATRLIGQIVSRDIDPTQSMRVLTGAATKLRVSPATLHGVIWRESRGAER